MATALMNPRPPKARSGSPSSSIPDHTKIFCSVKCRTWEKCSKSFVVSLIPTTFSKSQNNRATVSGARSTTVRDGTL